jgi:cysteine desulfurase/selenocysteine lyase
LRAALGSIPSVTVHDKGRVKGGIVTFSVAGRSAREVKEALALRRINVSISSVASARIDMEQRRLDEIIRASVHYFNTEDEIDFAVAVIAGL